MTAIHGLRDRPAMPRRGNTMIDVGRSKLSYDTAVQIRRRRAAGERGMDLAAEFGVSPQVVSDIVNRRRWVAPDREHYLREIDGWRSRALAAERRVEQLLYELSLTATQGTAA